MLYALKTAFPNCNYTALLRDEQKAHAISRDYPDLHIILGDLDSSSILEAQAREADIVVRE